MIFLLTAHVLFYARKLHGWDPPVTAMVSTVVMTQAAAMMVGAMREASGG